MSEPQFFDTPPPITKLPVKTPKFFDVPPPSNGKQWTPDEFMAIAGKPVPSTFAPDSAELRLSLQFAKSPDEVVTALGGDPSKMNDDDKNNIFKQVQIGKNRTPSRGIIGALGTSIARGAEEPIEGTAQLLAHGMTMLPGNQFDSNAQTQDLQARINDLYFKRETQNYPITRTVGQMVGQLPLMALAPEGEIGSLGAAARTGLFGAGIGLAQPVANQGSYGVNKALQGITGGIAAPLGQLAAEKVVSPALSKFLAAMKGKSGLPSEAAKLQSVADTLGIETTPADLVRNPTSNIVRMGQLQADAPLFGNAALHSRQGVQSQGAATDFLTSLQGGLENTPFSAQPELTAAANGKNQPQVLLDMFRDAGNNPGSIAQAETNAQLWLRQQAANQKYAKARALAPVGENATEAAQIGVKAQELLDAELAKGANKNNDLVSYLKGVVNDLNPNPAPAPSLNGQFMPSGGAPQGRYAELIAHATKAAEPSSPVLTTYPSLDAYTKGIGEKRLDFLRPGGMGTDASRVLGDLHSTARDVLDQIAAKSNNSEFVNATAEANNYYKNQIAKPYFDNPEVSALMSENTPDLKAASWKNMTPQQIQAVSDAMGPKGKSAVNVQLIQDALENATNNNRRMGYQFDPVAFSAFIQGQAKKTGITFSPEDLTKLNDMASLFNNLQFAGKTPPTSGSIRRMVMGEGSTLLKPLTQNQFGKTFLTSPGSTPIGPENVNDFIRGFISKQGSEVPAEWAGQWQPLGNNPAINNQ